MKLAVIPARGGSKRIPRKNVKPFFGKPIMAWSIEAAQKSGCFDRIIVSTDDDEIAAIARRWGAEIPFMRPVTLADDRTGTLPVVHHTVDWVMASGEQSDFICCIYATAAFVTPADLQHGLQVLQQEKCDYVFSVASYASPIQRALRMTNDGRVEMLHPEHFHTRSQDLEKTFHDAGQFYWGRADAWINERPIYSSDAIPLVLPHHRVQDIDTIEDWIHAERMFAAMRETDYPEQTNGD